MGAAVFGRQGDRHRTWGAVLGAFAPDLSLYLMAGVSILVLGISPQRVFGTLYYSPEWQQVFAVDNSFVLWGIGFALALWSGRGWAIALTGAALLHLAFDFPLHSHDARAHFWPLTDWKFISPVSYWQGPTGQVVGWIEIGLTVSFCAILVIRHTHWPARAGFLALGTSQMAPWVMWSFIF